MSKVKVKALSQIHYTSSCVVPVKDFRQCAVLKLYACVTSWFNLRVVEEKAEQAKLKFCWGTLTVR